MRTMDRDVVTQLNQGSAYDFPCPHSVAQSLEIVSGGTPSANRVSETTKIRIGKHKQTIRFSGRQRKRLMP